MTLVGLLRKWLVVTPVAGKQAFAIGVAAVALPTLYCLSLDSMVMGIGYCPYLPFILLAAVLLGWKQATGIAIVAVVVADALFIGPRYQLIEQSTDMLGDFGFLVASATIIGLVHAIRTAMEDLVGPTVGNGLFFSLKDGQAWASWPTAGFNLRLGPPDEIVEAMRDFIAQFECGKRLARETQSIGPDETAPA